MIEVSKYQINNIFSVYEKIFLNEGKAYVPNILAEKLGLSGRYIASVEAISLFKKYGRKFSRTFKLYLYSDYPELSLVELF